MSTGAHIRFVVIAVGLLILVVVATLLDAVEQASLWLLAGILLALLTDRRLW